MSLPGEEALATDAIGFSIARSTGVEVESAEDCRDAEGRSGAGEEAAVLNIQESPVR